ncbi:DUF6777 domain-containing protein [Streptacidiphilus sp. EB129]|uniref:DUF6777 domain-containing protein n=1 Tax=Streptacidiphilus sp. EB129 TaxID=3156262 RepID=UPI00351535F6
MSAASADRPRVPWWRHSGRIALITGAAALAAALVLVLTDRSPKPATTNAQNVALQTNDSAGPDPFTPTTVAHSASPSAATSAPRSNTPVATGSRTYMGSTEGLYGGTEQLSSCDVAQLSAFLAGHADKAAAWATVEGIHPSEINAYLGTLTPVVLRMDTRVTNHGFAHGAATSFQSVLQGGTAVLIDGHGLPRVRCACGNPLLTPLINGSTANFTGTGWSSFQPGNVIIVLPAVTQVTVIVLFDVTNGTWFGRPAGSHGDADHQVPPPPPPTPLPSASTLTSGSPSTSTSSSKSGSPTATPSTATPSTSASTASPSSSTASTSASISASTAATASTASTSSSASSASSESSTSTQTGSSSLSTGSTLPPLGLSIHPLSPLP